MSDTDNTIINPNAFRRLSQIPDGYRDNFNNGEIVRGRDDGLMHFEQMRELSYFDYDHWRRIAEDARRTAQSSSMGRSPLSNVWERYLHGQLDTTPPMIPISYEDEVRVAFPGLETLINTGHTFADPNIRTYSSNTTNPAQSVYPFINLYGDRLQFPHGGSLEYEYTQKVAYALESISSWLYGRVYFGLARLIHNLGNQREDIPYTYNAINPAGVEGSFPHFIEFNDGFNVWEIYSQISPEMLRRFWWDKIYHEGVIFDLDNFLCTPEDRSHFFVGGKKFRVYPQEYIYMPNLIHFKIREYPSSSTPGKSYTAFVSIDQRVAWAQRADKAYLSCNCKGWTARCPDGTVNSRTCRHVQQVQDVLVGFRLAYGHMLQQNHEYVPPADNTTVFHDALPATIKRGDVNRVAR